jgi:PPOX class probable F420-dependent enzyme
MIAPELERYLHNERIAWLTVVREDGMPLPTPVWFVWRDDTFLMFSQPGAFKLRAIARNPHVTLHFNTDPTGEYFVIAQCRAAIDPDSPPSLRLPEYQEKYRELIALIGFTPERLAAEFSLPLRLTPLRWRVQLPPQAEQPSS